MKYVHSYSCPYPEGCNCGVAELNEREEKKLKQKSAKPIQPHYLSLDLALIRWNVVSESWRDLTSDIPLLGPFLAGWFCRCSGIPMPENQGQWKNSFRAGYKEADGQIVIESNR